jgi:hypothetical protein
VVRGVEKAAVVVGFVLHAVIGFVPFAVSGLVAPLWGVAVLGVYWVALLIAGIALVRRGRPILVPLVPVAGLLGWFAFISFGEAVLGWTA